MENFNIKNIAYKHNKPITISLFVLLAFLISIHIALSHPTLHQILLLLILIICLCLYRKLEALFVITYFTISGSNLLKYFEDISLNIPIGTLTFRDLLFIIWMILFIYYYFFKTQKAISTPIIFPIIALILMGVFQIFYSTLFFDCPLKRALRGFSDLATFAYFLPFIYIIRNEGNLKKIFLFFYLLCFYYLISIILYYLFQIDILITGPIFKEDPIYFERITKFGEFQILTMTFVSLSAIFLVKKLGDKIFWSAVLSLLLVVIFLSYSRGYWVAATAGILVCFLICFKWNLKRIKLMTSLSIIALLILPFFYVLLFNKAIFYETKERVYSIYYDIAYAEGSWEERLSRIEFEIIKENWLFGVGYYAGDPLDDYNPYRPRGHNMYNTIILRWGIFGFSFLVYLWISFIKRAIYILNQTESPQRKSWVIGSIGMAFASLSHGIITSRYVYFYGILHIVFLLLIVEYIFKIETDKKNFLLTQKITPTSYR